MDPDIVVEQIRPEPEVEATAEHREEDLRGHLENGGVEADEDLETDAAAEEAEEEAEDDPTEGDYQLARAIEQLRGARILSGTSAVN